MYPVRLNVEGRACLVVGGGPVALRKIRGLIDEGARVTVVSPESRPEVLELAAAGAVTLEARPYRTGEAADYALVLAATNDREVNRQIYAEADAAGVWVNVADDPEICSFHLGGRVRLGPLELFLSSGGDAPFLVRRLREHFERRLGPTWEAWAAAAAELRERVRAEVDDVERQEAIFDRFFAETFDRESLEARVPTPAELDAYVRDADAASGPRQGFVSLVGSGPGHPGLLTRLGHARLLAADVVVYDRLAEPALPTDLRGDVELINVGKTAGHHPVPQEETTALLVRLGQEGRRVVRLKGGDPFVFGRGGEEAQALAAAGVPFEIVPGVTAGIAATAFAGIPVTHRGEAVRLTLVTAHESLKKDRPQVRWDLLGQDPHATLVGYMGLTALPGIVRQLLSVGMNPSTPAAMIERGTTASQRSVVSTVSELPGAVERAGLEPPALFVVGPTVARSAELDWRARQPLANRRIVVPAGASALAEALERAGAEVISVPLPLRPSARIALASQDVSAWILWRNEHVVAVAGLGPAQQGVALCRGPEIARIAREHGLPRVETVARDASHDQIIERLHALD